MGLQWDKQPSSRVNAKFLADPRNVWWALRIPVRIHGLLVCPRIDGRRLGLAQSPQSAVHPRVARTLALGESRSTQKPQ